MRRPLQGVVQPFAPCLPSPYLAGLQRICMVLDALHYCLLPSLDPRVLLSMLPGQPILCLGLSVIVAFLGPMSFVATLHRPGRDTIQCGCRGGWVLAVDGRHGKPI